MKMNEKAKYYEGLSRKRENIISAMVPLLKVEWTQEVRFEGAGFTFWTQHAFIIEQTVRDTLVAFHVRYAVAQPSLGNRRHKYGVFTFEEAKRYSNAYALPELLQRLVAIERRTEEIGKQDLDRYL